MKTQIISSLLDFRLLNFFSLCCSVPESTETYRIAFEHISFLNHIQFYFLIGKAHRIHLNLNAADQNNNSVSQQSETNFSHVFAEWFTSIASHCQQLHTNRRIIPFLPETPARRIMLIKTNERCFSENVLLKSHESTQTPRPSGEIDKSHLRCCHMGFNTSIYHEKS